MSTETETRESMALAARTDQIDAAMAEIKNQEKLFELAQRRAKVYANSTLVPKEYQGNIGNVLIAENMARRMGADVLMVMQNLYIVHGRPGWSSQFLIATFNANGRFSAIRYRFDGDRRSDDWGCIAYCTEHSTGEEIEGTRITMGMAKAEGWVSKSGSKWKTMPEQMMRYRSAAFLIRATAPEIGMGMLTKEELEDVDMVVDGTARRVGGVQRSSLNDDLDQDDSPSAAPDDEQGEQASGPSLAHAMYRQKLDATNSLKDLEKIRKSIAGDLGLPDADKEELLVDADERISILKAEMDGDGV